MKEIPKSIYASSYVDFHSVMLEFIRELKVQLIEEDRLKKEEIRRNLTRLPIKDE